MPSSPLGKGFLTGAIDASTDVRTSDFRNSVPLFSDKMRRVNLALIDEIGRTARGQGVSKAQVAPEDSALIATALDRIEIVRAH